MSPAQDSPRAQVGDLVIVEGHRIGDHPEARAQEEEKIATVVELSKALGRLSGRLPVDDFGH
jgi:hypothetical protein